MRRPKKCFYLCSVILSSYIYQSVLKTKFSIFKNSLFPSPIHFILLLGKGSKSVCAYLNLAARRSKMPMLSAM